ncbi:dihydroorotate dehydrogenase-like protein [Caldithrix abyssi]|uniref:Dihydroorotate dehydrogenase (Fumarate) n=1 Tax=Caldithrix abyssi DSM 13497 TaxID=880073 RepID=H1XQM0_CALAY|nr:dihydroorotate dehydrogenase-like protein [Caldithrix abyssi]APF17012.1 dihydroorotate dehydrogenase (fumarate) [Caldithrix abyssi DSM 13497]EHO41166.1 dihydroorotate oxidase [Caldithrix abyssi DSM 13497]
MDLKTKYLGLELKNPVVPSASPLSANVDTVKKMEDSGAAAVVMYSLFEEQIVHEQKELDTFLAQGSESFAEALSYFPEPDEFHNVHAEEYLEQIRKLKEAVDIPIIGSLNGVSAGGWMDYAKKIEEAGADALELNIYYIPTDPNMTSEQVEQMYIDDVKKVKETVNIPVAVKVGPFFTAFANMAKRLTDAGADGLVIFNRFYQPDIDIEALDVVHDLEFSTSYELRLPLRWLAILYGQVNASLAATTGIHTANDVLKAVMAGADVTMMASVLFQKGIKHIARVLGDIKYWMEAHEYESIEQMKGSMSVKSLAEPAAYMRANYMKTLQSII